MARSASNPQRARQSRQFSGPEAQLREEWRQHSLASGWKAPDDWWAPAVDAVTAAVHADGDLAEPLRALGEARGHAGAGIAETLDDLDAMLTVTGRADSALALAKPLAEGWAEAGLVSMTHATCEDPLTGMVTMPYLRTRLGEVYREALHDGTCPADTHRLLLVALPGGSSPWQRTSRAIVIGHDLRGAFPGGETLTLAGRDRLVVLASAYPAHDLATASLRRMLADAYAARLRVFRLPSRHEAALRLLAGLAQ
jgi:hypothetical protein